jgi:type II secretory pathway component HofQ
MHILAVASMALLVTVSSGRPHGIEDETAGVRPDSLQLPIGTLDTTSLSFRDTDLRDIFRALSVQHGVNVFLDNSINKRVTVSLNRVRVYDAIAFLASQSGLECHLEGGIFRIAPRSARSR